MGPDSLLSKRKKNQSSGSNQFNWQNPLHLCSVLLNHQILIDGKDIRQLDLRWLRSQIGVVHQEPVLFSGTVAENIAIGRLSATQEEIEAAARMADAHDFIAKLPQVRTRFHILLLSTHEMCA